MTDYLENIRRALEMGPTPGPWAYRDANNNTDAVIVFNPRKGHELAILRNGNEANARLIAACDPDTIRALVKERDALQRKLSLWEPIMAEIDRRAGKECCLEDRCDFTVTVEYEEYAAIAAANGGTND